MYQSIRNRIASVVPSLSESQLDWATPLAVGAATGLGASAFNVISPWDIDPVAASLASGGATYLMSKGRLAEPIESIVTAPPKPPTNPTKPTPKPRVAIEADVAPINPNTGDVSVVIPPARSAYKDNDLSIMTDEEKAYENYVSPTIEDYIAKSPLLNKERAMRYADPSSEEYQPDFVKMLTQELSDDFRAELAFPDDVLRETYRGSGVPAPVATGAVHLPILRGSFDYPTQRHKLNSDVIVFRGSSLVGGEGKSNLVNQGVVPEGTYYPNAVTSNPSSLKYISTGKDPRIEDPGFYIQDPRTKVFESVLEPNPGQAKEAYNQLITSGRMAVPMAQKSLNEPILYVDELSGGSSPYDINDFYGLKAAKKRTTDKATGNKYYRGVYDDVIAPKIKPVAADEDDLLDFDVSYNNPASTVKSLSNAPYLAHLDSAQEWIDNLPSQKYYQTTDIIDEIVDSNFNKGLEAYGLNPKTMPSNLKRFRQELGTDDFSQTAFVNQYLKAQGKPELPLPPLVLPKPIDDPQLKGIFYY